MVISLNETHKDPVSYMLTDDSMYEPIANDANALLDILQNMGKKANKFLEPERFVNQITEITQRALNASASLVLLLDNKGQQLVFEEGRKFQKVQLDSQPSIIKWVIQHAKPIIANDKTKNKHLIHGIDDSTGLDAGSIICAPLIVDSEVIGAIELLNKKDGSNFTRQDLATLSSVAYTAAVTIENVRLHQTMLDTSWSIIKALATAIDAKDHYTNGHSQRVMQYALLAGTSLSFSDDELGALRYAGMLHDIGKIGIPDSILTKAGTLTAEEWNLMRRHSFIGADIINSIPFLEQSTKMVRHHHERYDGKGYPDGLKKEAIPMGARILAVADAFDTMISDRSYRKALGVRFALNELRTYSGSQFCPIAVEAFTTGLVNHNKRLFYEQDYK